MIDLLVRLTLFLVLVLGHTVPGFGHQLRARTVNLIDPIFNSLSPLETDFINTHLQNLTSYASTPCNECKNRIRFAQNMVRQFPRQKHLTSLLLFKYCIIKHAGDESACDNVDFFVTTQAKGKPNTLGARSKASVDFFDNDFIHMVSAFNASSDFDLKYYCYFKGKKACPLPATPDVDQVYGVQLWWPQKQPHHFHEPAYSEKSRPFHVLHLSDLHTQARYTVGAESNCSGGKLCCLPDLQSTSLLPNSSFLQYFHKVAPNAQRYDVSFYPHARYSPSGDYIPGKYHDFAKYRGLSFAAAPATTFGAYSCDLPHVLLDSALKNVVSVHAEKAFEFSLFTGDIVDHDLLNCDPHETRRSEIEAFETLKRYLRDTPVFPSLGNHDTFPYGQLSPVNSSTSNVYNWNDELMSEVYVENGWLPELKRDQVRSHYSGFAITTARGLKIISLNSNCYYVKNMWAYLNMTSTADLFGQWKFLVDELVASEAAGQRVWILAHIPPSQDTLPIQSQIFAKIVERFSPYTIANIFFGHTHRDQFNILYAANSSKSVQDAINMAWVLQSVTPLADNNPSWRYYEVEDQLFNILNSFNYYTPLNDTFVSGDAEPKWQFEYSARQLYDPTHQWPSASPLNATFWHKFVVEKLAENNTAFHQVFTNTQYRQSPLVPDCGRGTDLSRQCWDENYCVTSNFASDEYFKCTKRAMVRV